MQITKGNIWKRIQDNETEKIIWTDKNWRPKEIYMPKWTY